MVYAAVAWSGTKQVQTGGEILRLNPWKLIQFLYHAEEFSIFVWSVRKQWSKIHLWQFSVPPTERSSEFASLLAQRLIIIRWKTACPPSFTQLILEVMMCLKNEKPRFTANKSHKKYNRIYFPFSDCADNSSFIATWLLKSFTIRHFWPYAKRKFTFCAVFSLLSEDAFMGGEGVCHWRAGFGLPPYAAGIHRRQWMNVIQRCVISSHWYQTHCLQKAVSGY